MTTQTYRMIVIGQIVGMCVLGLVAVTVFLGAVPEYRSRADLSDAIDRHAQGTETSVRSAQDLLDRVLADNPDMSAALALRGRIGLEQNNLSVAYDAFAKLEEVLVARHESTSPALNGQACAILLDARRTGAERNRLLQDAARKLAAASEQDPGNGDPHVNAAVCSLYLGDLEAAATHLKEARNTRNLSYESLVTYYWTLGATFSAASAQGRTAAAVAKRFEDADPELAKSGGMMLRADEEFDKAAAIARSEKTLAAMHESAAVTKARLLAWAPLSREQAGQCWEFVYQELHNPKTSLSPRDLQMFALVIAISQEKLGYHDGALHAIDEAGRHGELAPDLRFYLGATLFQIAQIADRPSEKLRLEADAVKQLLPALAANLPAALRFRALTTLSATQDHARDTSGAAKSLVEADLLLEKLDQTPGAVTALEKSRFYRNLGVLMYETGNFEAALRCLRKSLLADPAQKPVEEFLAKLSQKPVIADVKTVAAPQLPASMPIVAATVSGGGPVPVSRQDISVSIDGDPVAFTAGPDSRIYALPRKALAEGKHTVTIILAPAGKKSVKEEHEFAVKYEYRLTDPK